MAWMNFSNYRKRIWDFEYQGAPIHLVIQIKDPKLSGFRNTRHRLVSVTWSTGKFRGVKFDFTLVVNPHTKLDYSVLFGHLRKSLAYGLNPKTRAVTDRIIGLKPGEKHPIHNMVRTSSKL